MVIRNITSIVLMYFTCISISMSATVFENTYDINQFVLGSNAGINEQQTADQFTLNTNSVINEINWYGGLYGSTDTNLNRDFIVRIFSDNNGLPDTTIFEESLSASVTNTYDTGQHPNHNDMPIYLYETTISNIELQKETRYWISILNNSLTSEVGTQWVWQASSFDENSFVALSNDDSNSWNAQLDLTNSGIAARNSMAFSLVTVPLPPALYLFIAGIMSVGVFTKRS